jgi:tetratricopeptide (TPR) repeat protein
MYEAISDFTRAAQLDLKSTKPLLERGKAYARQRKPEKAIQDFNQALALEPSSVDAMRGRAAAYAALGEYKRSAADFDEVARLLPDDPKPKAEACRQRILGESLEPAIESCTQALLQNPTDVEVLELRAIGYLKLAHFDDAISDYDKALSIQPKHAGSLYGRGLAKKRKRESEEEPDILLAKSLVANISAEYLQFGLK